MGRHRSGAGKAVPAEAEDTDGVPVRYGEEVGENSLVVEVVDFLSDGSKEMQIVSSHFAVRFNHVVRNAPNSQYNPNKKNDGSFKKWLVNWGFEVNPTYDRNKSMVSIPRSGLPSWTAKLLKPAKAKAKAKAKEQAKKKEEDLAKSPHVAKEEEVDDDPYIPEEPTSSAGPFKPLHGKDTEEALALEAEALSYIRERGPVDIGALRSVEDLGTRFNKFFFRKQRVNDGSWKRWLGSMPDVEFITDPTKGHYHGNQPTLVRIRRGAAASAPAPPAQSEGRSILDALRDGAAASSSSKAAALAPAEDGPAAAAAEQPPGAAGAAEGEGEETEPLDPEDVPMYVFLDASATWRMLDPEAGLMCFEGLLNLCRQGHMKCCPVEGGRFLEMHNALPPSHPWAGGAVAEKERVLLALTSSVLDEMSTSASSRSPEDRGRLERLRTASDSYLHRCYAWGLLEVLDADLHRRTMQVTPAQEQRALVASLPQQWVKLLDFVYLWNSKVELEGKVLFVTADRGMQSFAESVALEGDQHGHKVPAVHLDDLNLRLSEDSVHGGKVLYEASQRPEATAFCGSTFSAATLAALAAEPPRPLSAGGAAEASAEVPAVAAAVTATGSGWLTDAAAAVSTGLGWLTGGAAAPAAAPAGPATAGAAPASAPVEGRPSSSTEALELELRRALELVAEVRRLVLEGKHDPAAGNAEVQGCLRRLSSAEAHWQALLAARGAAGAG